MKKKMILASLLVIPLGTLLADVKFAGPEYGLSEEISQQNDQEMQKKQMESNAKSMVSDSEIGTYLDYDDYDDYDTEIYVDYGTQGYDASESKTKYDENQPKYGEQIVEESVDMESNVQNVQDTQNTQAAEISTRKRQYNREKTHKKRLHDKYHHHQRKTKNGKNLPVKSATRDVNKDTEMKTNQTNASENAKNV